MSEAPRLVIGVGSNIEPRVNLPAALGHLRRRLGVEAVSAVYETEPVAAPSSPVFWNAALLVRWAESPASLKKEVLRPIEEALGRVRGEDPNAPRQIDLDIVLSSAGSVEDPETGLSLPDPQLSLQAHLVVPVADVVPDWIEPESGRSYMEIAASLAEGIDRVVLPGWRG